MQWTAYSCVPHKEEVWEKKKISAHCSLFRKLQSADGKISDFLCFASCVN